MVILPWILQRVSGVGLVALLFIHIWLTHYSPFGERITFNIVQVRLENLALFLVDLTMLGLLVFHGLNGLRNIALDYPPGMKNQRVLSWGLLLVGLLTFLLGTYVLLFFR